MNISLTMTYFLLFPIFKGIAQEKKSSYTEILTGSHSQLLKFAYKMAFSGFFYKIQGQEKIFPNINSSNYYLYFL